MRTRTILSLMLVSIVAHCPAPAAVANLLKPLRHPWSEVGMASWYGSGFHPKMMANGRKFNITAMTCDHRFLPLGSKIWVRSSSGKKVRVVVTDRGPFKSGRILDLSLHAATLLGIVDKGLDRVTITLCPATQR